MSCKSVTIILEEHKKIKNVAKKCYGPSEKKEKKLKNVLKNRYGCIGT